ncbi:PLP-dependent aminotransferase family protein [Pedosphaera parvula]|uniref:Transcriptional regulator, GntR family with aminotransferase domain n=1 Tax=Pedosphaera parvula (strain Ellin514) TaxID=320771 RepID=B9XN81_PEDPL|nr:PLP-dependent aminotransferase family protein [Pedosphaera parvula]EEF58743.1 transcriptional regulator, GntR family with aminotransferase domain [Pedosphaera parvula Ellin514]
MAKNESSVGLLLASPPADLELNQWLHRELRAAILDRRLKPGARLPSTRQLARQYQISRGTVTTAFEQLRDEGYLEGQIGSGTYVAKDIPDGLLQARGMAGISKRTAHSRATLSSRGERISSTSLAIKPVTHAGRAFRAYHPALDVFPLHLWSRMVARRSRQSSRILLAGGEPAGYRPLREALAGYLGSMRGVKCSQEQVVIVSGIQQALDIVARLVLDPGDAVWMENPGYIGASAALRAAGGEMVPIPVDKNGLNVRTGVNSCPQARLAYVTPAHQFPLGVVLSLERRLALLNWANEARAWIFEDDYDSEYRYSGRPFPALQGLDQSGSVIYAGSFNKMLFPSLRLGYLVLPPRLVEPFVAARSIVDRYPPVLDQAVVCDFMVEGYFGQHIRRMREIYAERRLALIDAARSELQGLLRVDDLPAGLHTNGWFECGISDRQATAAASAAEIEVMSLSSFGVGRRVPNGLMLGFATVNPAATKAAVTRLAKVLENLKRNL